jgi:hypothetical protein
MSPVTFRTDTHFTRNGYAGQVVDTAMDVLVAPNKRDDDAVLA